MYGDESPWPVVPVSLVGLAIALILYGLEHIPIVGTLALMTGSVFWTTFLVNAAFIGTAVEVIKRRVAPGWLVFPAAWFGIYAGYVAIERHQITELGKRYAAENAKIRMAFDPTGMALVWAGSGGDTAMLTDFGLPVIYNSASDGEKTTTRATRLADMDYCRTVWNARELTAAQIFTSGFHDEVPGRLIGRFEERFCEISMPESPSLPQVVLTTRDLGPTQSLETAMLTETTITTPNGKKHRLIGGHAEVLPWFPMPVAACVGEWASVSKGDSCGVGFHRSDTVPLIDKGSQYRSDSISLAETLGLSQVPPDARRATDTAEIERLVDQRQDAAMASAIAQLHAVLTDPFAKVDWITFDIIERHPDRFIPLSGRIARAFAATVTRDYRGQDNGRNLSRLLAILPDSQFEKVRPIIEAAYRNDHSPWLRSGTTKLQGRLTGSRPQDG